MEIRIKIQGYEMELGEEPMNIARTIQAFDFLSLGSSVITDRTNRLSLPLTNNNISNLGLMGIDFRSPDNLLRNLSVEIIQKELTTVGVCQIVSMNTEIQLDVQGSLKTFFSALDGKYLNDLDLSTWNGLWDNARRDTVRNATSGLVSGVTNNGNLVNNVGGFVDGYTYGGLTLPMFYYKTLIDKVFTLTGHTYIGAVFSDTNRFTKMVMSTRLVYNQEFVKKINLPVTSDDHSLLASATNFLVLKYKGASTGTYGLWTLATSGVNDASRRITFDLPGSSVKLARVKFTFSGYVTVNSGTPPPTLNVKIKKNNTTFLTATSQTLTANYVQAIFETEVANADYYSLVLESTFAGNVTISGISFTVEFLNTTDLYMTQKSDWHWLFNELLPRFELRDFIRDFMRMFGLAMRDNGNNVIEFKYIKDILNSTPTTVELSRVNTEKVPSRSFVPEGFAELNNYKWIVLDAETSIDTYYGRGIITIDNDTLEKEVDKYESMFTASRQLTADGINSAAVVDLITNIQDDTDDLVMEGGATKTGTSKYKKTGGAAATWDSSIRSVEGTTDYARAQWRFQVTGTVAAGLSSTPTLDKLNSSIDYAFQWDATPSLKTYVSGVLRNTIATPNINDTLEIIYDPYTQTVFWIRNGVVVDSIARTSKLRLYFDGSFYTSNTEIDSLVIINKEYKTLASFGARLFLLRDDDGMNFRFNTTSRTDYFIAYFIDNARTYSLDWQQFLDEFYSEYIDMIKNYVSIEQDFLITWMELDQIDLFSLKHKDGVLYLLEKISDHIDGKFATFKLIKR